MLKIYNKKLVICVYLLAIFGIVMIYSASSYTAELEYGDKFFYVKKQAIAFVVAIIAQIFVKNISFDLIKKSSVYIYILSVILLLALFIPGVGISNYGATRWINLGITTFQPSELAKFSLVMIIALFLSKESATKWSIIIKVGIVSLIVVGLILLEPNMSIAMCISCVVLIMLVIGGMKIKHFSVILIPVVGAVIGLILLEPYRLSRLMAFVDPWASPLKEGYQLIQSYYALAGGGLFGVGLFNSIQKYLFLPFAESDFIFSIIGEELGLVGCIIIIIVYIVIFYEGIRISVNAKDRYSAYLSSGIISVIIVQTLLNIAVVSGSIPPTGLPLPFVSYGGSSLVVMFMFVGVLENISKSARTTENFHKMY